MQVNYFFGSDSRSIPAYEALRNASLTNPSINKNLKVVSISNTNRVRGKDKPNDFVTYCIQNNINHTFFNTEDTYEDLEIGFVCSFGKIFSREFLSRNNITNPNKQKESKLINLHLSILPDLKGPSPIEHSILYSYTHTGITLFEIDEDIDSGKIIWQEEFSISPQSYASDLYTIAFQKFNEFIHREDLNNTFNVDSNNFVDQGRIKKTYKIGDCDLLLDNVDVDAAKRRIRAFNVIGPAKYTYKDIQLKVHTYEENFEGLDIQLGDAKLTLGIITPPGRNKMNSLDWLRGKK